MLTCNLCLCGAGGRLVNWRWCGIALSGHSSRHYCVVVSPSCGGQLLSGRLDKRRHVLCLIPIKVHSSLDPSGDFAHRPDKLTTFAGLLPGCVRLEVNLRYILVTFRVVNGTPGVPGSGHWTLGGKIKVPSLLALLVDCRQFPVENLTQFLSVDWPEKAPPGRGFGPLRQHVDFVVKNESFLDFSKHGDDFVELVVLLYATSKAVCFLNQHAGCYIPHTRSLSQSNHHPLAFLQRS